MAHTTGAGTRRVSRRQALKLAAAAGSLPLVHIRTAGAAGKVSVAFWDHWVPVGNDVIKKQVEAWADKNKVEAQVDFITSNGFKNILTQTAEAQAKTGHDIQQFPQWQVLALASSLEPIDDVMGRLTAKYGPVSKSAEYLARLKGHWLAVPCSTGTQVKGPCARISMFKQHCGLDVQAMYPVANDYTAGADAWDYNAFLKAAEQCAKAGVPFGIGLGTTADSVDTAGAIFAAHGADLIDGEGAIKVNSPEVHAALEYCQKLVKFLPDDAVSYDDASNNRALISGKSALIMNPPSAWAVAKRDAPKVAEDCWTFSAPKGPKGRFVPTAIFFWGVWNFSPNKTAAKELIEYLSQRDLVKERCDAVSGYDIPPFDSMLDFDIWKTVSPPPGTVYNYPIRPSHHGVPNIACSSAAPEVAVQMYNRGTMPTMMAKLKSGQSIPEVIAWAKNELEGFAR
ncbi:MAG: extracellular solute-binding protein [Proteobacteria bacterium]|nr:extracellular solute-binding protein [Pseudomonadota bacterium]